MVVVGTVVLWLANSVGMQWMLGSSRLILGRLTALKWTENEVLVVILAISVC
jgi:hypothetical protein